MQQQESKKRPEEAFESDTQKIIRRHLENENDEITDEDIRNVRVGIVPPLEDIKHYDDVPEEKASDADRPVTPWDTVEDDK